MLFGDGGDKPGAALQMVSLFQTCLAQKFLRERSGPTRSSGRAAISSSSRETRSPVE